MYVTFDLNKFNTYLHFPAFHLSTAACMNDKMTIQKFLTPKLNKEFDKLKKGNSNRLE